MTALSSHTRLICESPSVACGGFQALLFLGSDIPCAGQAGPAADGVADGGGSGRAPD